MSYHLATAFVKVGTDLAGLGSGLSKAKSMVTRSLGGIAGMIAKITAAGAGLAGVGLGFAVKLGSDAQEMSSMFDAVFKEQSAGADKFANDFALKIGRSVNDVKGQMAGFQDTFVPLGFARDEAAGLSKQLAMVTADLASFKNKNDADVARTLTSALTGEREALKGLGIVIQEVDVKNELLRMGMAKATGDTLKQAKAQATLNLILRNSKDAQGDAERTAGSFSNRMRGLQGAIKDVSADIGSAFLPMLAQMAKKATDMIRAIQPRIKAFAESFAAWSDVIMNNWSTVWDIVKLSMEVAYEDMKATVAAFPAYAIAQMANMAAVTENVINKMVRNMKNAYLGFFVSQQKGWDQWLENVIAHTQGREAMDLSGNRNREENARRAFGLDKPIQMRELIDIPDLVRTSEKANEGREKMQALVKQLMDLRNAKKAVADVGDVDVKAKVDAKVAGVKFDIPKGFFDLGGLNKAFQDSMLKTVDPQKQVVGEIQAGNEVNRQMQNTLLKIAENTKGMKQGAGALPGAR